MRQMPKIIDYYFTPMSPFVYLAQDRLLAIAEETGAHIAYRPVEIAKIFAVSARVPIAQRPIQRQTYRLMDIARLARYLGLPLIPEPTCLPTSDQESLVTMVAAEQAGADLGDLARRITRAVWVEDRDIGEISVIRAILEEAGLDAGTILAAAAEEETYYRLEAITQEAIDRQVFGVPTFIVDQERFWGQDRLELLRLKLTER